MAQVAQASQAVGSAATFARQASKKVTSAADALDEQEGCTGCFSRLCKLVYNAAYSDDDFKAKAGAGLQQAGSGSDADGARGTVLLDPRDPLLQSERTQGFTADPVYGRAE